MARDAISQEEADTRAAEARQAEAACRRRQRRVEAARLDVEFTEVRAPISGRVGRKLVTEGNLINGGSGTQGTLLTTIVSLDPIYVYFEADERAYLKYTRLAQEGKRPSSRNTRNPVQVGFADEEGFPHQGYMDFVDNHLDPSNRHDHRPRRARQPRPAVQPRSVRAPAPDRQRRVSAPS